MELQVTGLVGQEQAKTKEIELVNVELAGARELYAKGLMPISKFTALQREATRLEGERGSIIAGIGQAKGKIAETELAILRVDRDLSSEVGNELRDVEAKIAEYEERKVTAEDQIRRVDIRSPQDGTVHQSIAHTIGGVVGPGEQIMLVVPFADMLMVEAKVAPQDIDQLQMGQPAQLRFSAFNQRTTPELTGTVRQISADAVTDPRTNLSAYVVRVGLDAEQQARLGELKLVPGMPAEVFFQTGERKAMSYFMKPLRDQLSRTFRED
jgi:HlyD family secretion protein